MEKSSNSKYVYLLNKSVFSEKDSYYTKEADNTKVQEKSVYDDSQFPTEKKDFKSDMNPHKLKRDYQKETYVWFGTYNKWMSSEDIIRDIRTCQEDSALPTESAAIHLKDYDLVFQKNGDSSEAVLVKNPESGVCLVKIYLIKKVQIEHFINLETKSKFQEEVKEGDISILDDSKSIHDGVINVGELDQLPIYIMTNKKAFESVKNVEVAPPSVEYLRDMYKGLQETFTNYSEQMLLYYLYKIDPVSKKFSTEDLMRVVQGEEAVNAQKVSEESFNDTVK